MDFIDKIKLNMQKSEIQDIEAWIEMARRKGIFDKIARLQFSGGFKSNEEYARFLELMKKQAEEKLALMERHFKEQDDFYKEAE